LGLELSRFVPGYKVKKTTSLIPVMSDVHSKWVYKRFEGASDGVIDFKLDETTDPAQNVFRIRSMRNVGFDGGWHRLKIGENFEVTLEK